MHYQTRILVYGRPRWWEIHRRISDWWQFRKIQQAYRKLSPEARHRLAIYEERWEKEFLYGDPDWREHGR